jgi:hypothetical protein
VPTLPVHLFAADGSWIAWYRPALPYVWNVGNRWIGWFPWPAEPDLRRDVVDPAGDYLGTVVGDRLFALTFRLPRPLPERVPEPHRPPGSPDVARTTPLAPPAGYVDVPARRLRRA